MTDRVEIVLRLGSILCGGMLVLGAALVVLSLVGN